MASLGNYEPKQFGDDNWMPTGWNRVITGECSLKYIGANKTPQINQKLFSTDGKQEITAQHWVAKPSSLERFAGYAEAMGLDRDQRQSIETETIETLSIMEDRNLWVMVDYRQNDKNGKWYKEVTKWRPDAEEAPPGEAQYKENPAFAAGAKQQRPAQAAGGTYSPTSTDDDDIPF